MSDVDPAATDVAVSASSTRGGNRRTRMAIGVLLVAVIAAGVGVLVGRQLQSPADAAASAKAPTPSRITVPVEKRKLVAKLIANGDVQYTEPTSLRLAGAVGASAGAAQIVTKAPVVDQPIEEGDVVMEVSGRPIFVFQGALPTFRGIEPGSTGPDVQQLEEALARLGVFDATPDTTYDETTETAIDRLYYEAGYPSEGASPEQQTQQRAAQKSVADANKALGAAQQELASGGQTLTAAQRLAAEQQRQAARDAVPAAQTSAARRNADAQAAVTSATATRDLALTSRNAAKAAKDAASAPGAVNPDTGVPFTALELAALSDVLTTRETALIEAEAALRTATSARDQTATDAAKEVKAAQEAADLAELQYADAVAPKDVRILQANVRTAQEAVVQANRDLATIQTAIGTKVPVGEILYLPTLPTTITQVDAVAGKAPADPFATASGTDTTIQGRISASDADLVTVPSNVDIALRDAGITTTGTLTSIEKPKDTQGSDPNGGGFGGGGGSSDGAGRLVVVITPDDPSAIANFVGFSARITITVSSTDAEVLAVPVAAVSMGGNGESRVEVERSEGTEPGATEMVEVTVGLSADGYVEITPIGAGTLAEGDRVVVGRARDPES